MNTQSSHLTRQLGLGSAIAVVVGSTIGSGIFKSPSGIATLLPGPLPMLMVWIVAGLIVMCGALTLAEIGSAFPYSGGIYVYLREAYGRKIAALFVFAQLVLIRPSSVGAVALVFGSYAARLMNIQGDTTVVTAGLAVCAITVVTVANVFGVKFGATIQNLTTLAKCAGLLLLVILAYVLSLPSHGGNFSPATPTGSFTWTAFGLALVSVLWAYDGWADGSYVGGEMRDAARTLPRSILFGTLIIISIYLLTNIAYLSIFSVGEIAASKTIAADSMAKLVGNWGVTFIVAVVMISTFGTLNGSVLTSPRIFFAASEDGIAPEILCQVHPKHLTPYISVGLVGFLGASYVIVASIFAKSDAFSKLTDAFVISLVPFYMLVVGSVFIFRKRQGGNGLTKEDSLIDEQKIHPYNPTSRVPLFPILPVLFILANAFLLVNSLTNKDSRIPTILVLGVLFVGFSGISRLYKKK